MAELKSVFGFWIVCVAIFATIGEALEIGVKNQTTNVESLLYVATTTPASTVSTKAPSRYEQGIEDYEEAVARVEGIKEQQRSDSMSDMFSLFGTLNSAWTKVNSAKNANNEEKRSLDAEDTRIARKEDVGEGRYIKGDPLKGYYDFIITEGSYKFWAVFQLLTAGLMIYSTFAAIYYSKVNPIVSDYDYVSYLGGRSLADDPEPAESGAHPVSSLLRSGWMQNAAHGFEFVLDAIEKIPAQR